MGQAVRSLVAATAACLLLPLAATGAAGVGSDEPAREPSARGAGEAIASERPIVDEPDAVPGELLVRFRAGATAAERAAARAGAEARLLDRLPIPGLELLQAGPDAAATARALERRPDVLYAEPNYVAAAATTPNDPKFPNLWGLHNSGQSVEGLTGADDADADAPEAWDHTRGRSGVTVAVVDSGVAVDHPDLAANVWTNSGEVPGNRLDDDGNGYPDDVHGWDWVDDDADPYDLNGHGTHVAGTVGAVGDNGVGVTGVAWDVSLVPLRVLGPDGYGTYADIVDAFAYAGGTGVDVVNASLGGPDRSQAMADVIARYPQTLFITAAGNAGADNDVTPDYPCNYPAANLLCVAATDNSNRLADFSNHGATSVDLAAPGVSTLSTVPPEEVVWQERFEEAGWSTRWASGGTATWGVESDKYGDFVSDSPGSRYASSTNTWLRTTAPLDLRGGRNCMVDYWLGLDVEQGYDVLRLEASLDGTSWEPLSAWSESFDGWWPARDGLRRYDGHSSLYLRFRLTSDGSVEGDGAKVDDVVVSCQYSYDGDEYAFYDGTSMASPHVAGAAALLYAADRKANVAEISDALLSSVDPVSTLSGMTVAGGRLNVHGALHRLAGHPPDAAPTSVSLARLQPYTTAAASLLAPNASDGDGVRHFELRSRQARFDGDFGSWSSLGRVASGSSVRVATDPGRTVCFSARATDVHGATSAWSPRRCTVVPLDDRAPARSTGWRRTTDVGAFRGTLSVASRQGAALSVAGAAVRRIALVATKAPGSGTVDVYLGRTLLKRISLAAPTTRKRQVVPVATWTRPRTGNVRVAVRTSGKPVRVDGLALGR